MKLNDRVLVSFHLTAIVLACSWMTACGDAVDSQDDAVEEVEEVDEKESELVTLEYDETVSSSEIGMPTEIFFNTGYALASFESDGDYLWIQDTKSDSKHPGIHWRTFNPSTKKVQRRGIIRDRLGKGPLTVKNKNFPEDVLFQFRVGRCNPAAHNCRHVEDYANWTAWATYNTAGF